MRKILTLILLTTACAKPSPVVDASAIVAETAATLPDSATETAQDASPVDAAADVTPADDATGVDP